MSKEMMFSQNWDFIDFNQRCFSRVSGLHAHYIELMQYTGLKDKKGKEIYEGDIITVNDSNGKKVICVVEWEHSGWGKRSINYGQAIWERWNEYQVIGNIHENPELLKS
jgi:uncharacterized phage protein (TIGR01671 family)